MSKEVSQSDSLDPMERVPRQDIPLTFDAGQEVEIKIKDAEQHKPRLANNRTFAFLDGVLEKLRRLQS